MKLTIGAVILEPGSSVRTETGGWRTFRPVLDPIKCNGCGLCWLYCPEAATTKGKPPRVDYRYCKGCGICAVQCPQHAITMVPEVKG